MTAFNLDLAALGPINLGSLLPSTSDIATNLALGAATSVVLAGVKSNAGQDAMDPLHLFHHDPQVAPVAASNNPASVVGPTVTASAFASLPATTQAQLSAAGVHIVAG